MFDKNAIKNSFSRAAIDYDAHAKLQENIRKKAVSLASSYFPKNPLVLDIGCGTGSLVQEKKSWNIVGVDIAYGMCVLASAKNSQIINADAENLPFADESFDCVFSSLVLQWIDKPEKMIKEILRVLKPEGTAVVTSFVHGTLYELEQAFAAFDSTPHITNFIESSQLLLRVAHIGGLVMNVHEETYIQYYDDVMSLMRSIKNIGASNKLSGRRKGMMTASQLEKVQKTHRREKGKYPANWNVLTMVIGKA